LFGADGPALVEAPGFVCLAVGKGPVADAGGVVGAAVVEIAEGEFDDHEGFFGRLPGGDEGVGKDEALIGDDFKIDAAAGEFGTVRGAHDDEGGAAGADVGFDDGGGERGGGEPLAEEFGAGPGVEDFLRRGVDDAAQDEVAAFGGGGGFRGGQGGLAIPLG